MEGRHSRNFAALSVGRYTCNYRLAPGLRSIRTGTHRLSTWPLLRRTGDRACSVSMWINTRAHRVAICAREDRTMGIRFPALAVWEPQSGNRGSQPHPVFNEGTKANPAQLFESGARYPISPAWYRATASSIWDCSFSMKEPCTTTGSRISAPERMRNREGSEASNVTRPPLP